MRRGEQALGQADSQYADRTDGWLSRELKARGVEPEQMNRRWVDEAGTRQQRTANGVRAEVVRAALAKILDGEG